MNRREAIAVIAAAPAVTSATSLPTPPLDAEMLKLLAKCSIPSGMISKEVYDRECVMGPEDAGFVQAMARLQDLEDRGLVERFKDPPWSTLVAHYEATEAGLSELRKHGIEPLSRAEV